MNTRYALDISVVMAPISHHSQNMDLSQHANCGAKLDRNDSYSKKRKSSLDHCRACRRKAHLKYSSMHTVKEPEAHRPENHLRVHTRTHIHTAMEQISHTHMHTPLCGSTIPHTKAPHMHMEEHLRTRAYTHQCMHVNDR